MELILLTLLDILNINYSHIFMSNMKTRSCQNCNYGKVCESNVSNDTVHSFLLNKVHSHCFSIFLVWKLTMSCDDWSNICQVDIMWDKCESRVRLKSQIGMWDKWGIHPCVGQEWGCFFVTVLFMKPIHNFLIHKENLTEEHYVSIFYRSVSIYNLYSINCETNWIMMTGFFCFQANYNKKEFN